VALIQTPHRFRTKRQLWTYSGLGLETRDSGEYHYVQGQVRRRKKQVSIRGLNKDHNHDLKGLFKAAATIQQPVSHSLYGSMATWVFATLGFDTISASLRLRASRFPYKGTRHAILPPLRNIFPHYGFLRRSGYCTRS
jgi:hypothetical protein